MRGTSRWIAVLAVAAIAFVPDAEAQVFVPGPVMTTQWGQPAFVAPAPVTVTSRYGLFGRRRSTVVTQRPPVWVQPAPVFAPAPVVQTSGFWTPQPVWVR